MLKEKKLQMTDEGICFWFNHIKAQKNGIHTRDVYCQIHNLNRKKFCNLSYRLFLRASTRNPNYEAMCQLAREYRKEKISKREFCELYNLEKTELNIYYLHTLYTDILIKIYGENYINCPVDERYLNLSPDDFQHEGFLASVSVKPLILNNERDSSKSFFYRPIAAQEVSPVPPPPFPDNPEPVHIAPCNAQVIEPKNNIEIVISDGVKVIATPEVSSEKLIKLITFLREL